MDSESSIGQTVLPTRVNSSITIFMEWVSIPGLMAANTMETGLITRCMAVVFLLGPMADVTTATTMMIASRVSECSCGQMDVDTRAAG